MIRNWLYNAPKIAKMLTLFLPTAILHVEIGGKDGNRIVYLLPRQPIKRLEKSRHEKY